MSEFSQVQPYRWTCSGTVSKVLDGTPVPRTRFSDVTPHLYVIASVSGSVTSPLLITLLKYFSMSLAHTLIPPLRPLHFFICSRSRLLYGMTGSTDWPRSNDLCSSLGRTPLGRIYGFFSWLLLTPQQEGHKIQGPSVLVERMNERAPREEKPAVGRRLPWEAKVLRSIQLCDAVSGQD